MASQEAAPEAGPEKAAAGVRSVLLKRDSPGAEDRLQRRRHRAQQVRFKDLEEGGEEPLGSHTPRASAANCARRSWPQSGPRLLLALPDPHGATGISTASQTSPSLQRPLRSKSSCDLAQEGAPCAVGRNQDPPPGGTTSLPALGCSLASPYAQQCPRLPATLCPGLPPPRGSCPPYPGRWGPCLSASCSSQCKHCAPSSMQPLGTPSSCGISGTPWLCPPPLCQIPSEQASRAPPCAPQRGVPSPSPLAQGPPTEDPTPAFLLPIAGPPKSGKPAAPAASPGSLSTTQAHPTAPTPSQKPSDPLLPSSGRSCPPETCLSARPCIQDHLLQLVSVAQGPPCPAATEREPPPASQDLPGRVGDIHSQLQSLEGVLETSQRTIQVLLDVIQDLEKKEAQRDGRQSYRTGQDTTNCGTCRDCACIIYSVEHDFRKQEGRLQQVLSTIEPERSHSPPGAMRAATPSHQELSPTLNLPVVKAEPKKSRRKCFWFL